MIVYPGGLIASELAAGRPMNYPRIGYDNYGRLTTASVTSTTESISGPKDAPLRPDTLEYWSPTALPAEWVLNFGAAKSLGFIGIASHDLGSSGCTVTCHRSTDGAIWTVFSSAHVPTDNSPILFLDTPVTANYMRVTVTGGVTMPKLAVIYAAAVLAVQRPIFDGYKPIQWNRKTVLFNKMSRRGHFLSQLVKRGGLEAPISLKFLTSTWYDANFEPFAKSARQYPYFFAHNPQLYTKAVAFGWTGEDMDPSYTGEIDYVDISWKMIALGHD